MSGTGAPGVGAWGASLATSAWSDPRESRGPFNETSLKGPTDIDIDVYIYRDIYIHICTYLHRHLYIDIDMDVNVNIDIDVDVQWALKRCSMDAG